MRSLCCEVGARILLASEITVELISGCVLILEYNNLPICRLYVAWSVRSKDFSLGYLGSSFTVLDIGFCFLHISKL